MRLALVGEDDPDPALGRDLDDLFLGNRNIAQCRRFHLEDALGQGDVLAVDGIAVGEADLVGGGPEADSGHKQATEDQ